jgi:hypothetical protein
VRSTRSGSSRHFRRRNPCLSRPSKPVASSLSSRRAPCS